MRHAGIVARVEVALKRSLDERQNSYNPR